MKRAPRRADFHLWRLVAATVRPFPDRAVEAPPALEVARVEPRPAPQTPTPPAPAAAPLPPMARPAQAIEPTRLHRLATGRLVLDGRLDLHAMSQDRARAALTAFLLRGHAEGRRAILVITGKGAFGGGVLRRRVPEWLAEPPLRGLIAGLSAAHRRHGGDGAIYVALKRAR
ncbi:MAG: Smr/MutS family protein [Caulobacteraceae bacterium]